MPKDVRYRIEADSSHELQNAILRYKESYHPLAYDTRVIKTTQEDAKYVAYVSRMSSCD